MKKTLITLLLLVTACSVGAQNVRLQTAGSQMGSFDNLGNQRNNGLGNRNMPGDSLGSNKEIPIGIHVWTVDENFGDRTEAELDTMPHMYPNTIFNTGLRGEYNTTGNIGSPRLNRIFIDRDEESDFLFTLPYDYFIQPVSAFHFTNTLSPFTNISYNNAGNRTNGEDHFTAKFGVNAGKKLGVGFKFDYIYGRGYYSNQATSHFNYTGYASYIGDRYQAHLLFSTNHEKVTENGGITNDRYVTHPESFDDNYSTSELPTVLTQNWNRNDNQHLFFSHRYNVGFNRKVKMTEEEIKARKFAMESKKENDAKKERDRKRKEQGLSDEDDLDEEDSDKPDQTFSGRPDDAKIAGMEPADSTKNDGRIAVNGAAQADSLIAAANKAKEDTAWLKNEYVPVTSFIHTLSIDNYRRIYQAYETPADYYANTYTMAEKLLGDSIYDQTKHYSIRNTFAISLLEGFNKWAKAGLKGFVAHELRHFTLPDTEGTKSFNKNSVYVGGQLSKTQGHLLHFNVLGEFGIVGEHAGELKIDGSVDLNIPLFGDTLQIVGNAFFHRMQSPFYYQHYSSKHFLWDNENFDKLTHSRIGGTLSYPKTGTTVRVAVDELTNYTYFGMSYNLNDSTFARTAMNVTPRQSGDAITVITAELAQNFKFGPLGWETVVTWQKSTKQDILPVPDLNIYTNLFLKFKIARVLSCELGADLRYFTKYHAPEYSPALGYYAVQENEKKIEIGNYPLVNAYLNFHLKHTRFFVMFSHVNAGSGNKNYFFTPHYPLNERILRFGLSWNFFN